MKGNSFLYMAAVSLGLFCVFPAKAVCFYPNSLVSGYQIPLRKEVDTTQNIIIGKVVGVKGIKGDPKDPRGVTSWIYKVKVLKDLKGKVAGQVRLYAENDSGGYRMNLGETDLLFLTPENEGFTADVCGNSNRLPKGDKVVKKVLQILSHPDANP